MKKADSLFFINIEIDKKIEKVIEELKNFSNTNSQQVYIIRKPLGSSIDFNYDINDIILVLIPKHPILILSYGNYDDDQLNDYKEDLKDDLGVLSSKYEYNKILDRPRKWDDNLIIIEKIDDFDVTAFLDNKVDLDKIRKIDLLISLLIGSINDINKIGVNEPETTLDRVKQKIVLFDGSQSDFIYLNSNNKDITIQGMAGTGKTELLLYKLKEIFIDKSEKDSVIAFTCYNKVLASEMRKRIPAFFNAMKIEEQIQWNEKMFVFPSWGSVNDKVSGMYRYICSVYDLPFYTYSQNNDFDDLCKKTLDMLNLFADFTPCFDYVFIDESQDFGNSFFELCNKVTRNKVFIAGDIFQNIFDNNFDDNIAPDYLLNNCYRTDPKTLMIAHSIGLGLCEHPPISWLNDSGWKACGYQIKRNPKKREFSLTRRPLRRFEDIQTEETFGLIPYEKEKIVDVVLDIIGKIKDDNSTVMPDDIAVILITDFKRTCEIADKIEYKIGTTIGWECAKGYETKEKKKDKLFISNVNNIKGLEFPFIICVTIGEIGKGTNYRNSIYMALTRSFLTSYFLIEDSLNSEFIDAYSDAMDCIKNNECLQLIEPTEQEKQDLKHKIIIESNRSAQISDIVKEVLLDYDEFLSPDQKRLVKGLIGTFTNEPIETIKQKTIQIITSVISK